MRPVLHFVVGERGLRGLCLRIVGLIGVFWGVLVNGAPGRVPTKLENW